MKKIFFALVLLGSLPMFAQTGTGWVPQRYKYNFRDSIYIYKDINIAGPFRIDGVTITPDGTELNILNGALVNTTELNRLVGLTSPVQTQLNGKVSVADSTGNAPGNYVTRKALSDSIAAGGGGGGGTWGSIIGTLSDQTDLQTALNAKAQTESPTFTTSATLPTATSIGNVSSTEISYVDGAASNLQEQLYDTTTLDLELNARTASYTLVISDNYKLVTISNAGAVDLTVPPNSSVPFPIGANITIVGIGAGQVTVVEGSGVTINSADGALKLRLQYSTGTLIKIATDTWLLIGDIST